MEINLGHVITFAVAITINGILFIVFIMRLEGRLLLVTTQLAEVKTETKEMRNQLDSHRDNQEIHFSLAVQNQVQKRTDEKFSDVEKQLTKMDSSFNDRLSKIESSFNNHLSKIEAAIGNIKRS